MHSKMIGSKAAMRLSIHAGLWMLLAGFACQAAEPSVEDRLKALESQVSALSKENAQLRQELGIGGKADKPFVRPAGREDVLSVGGLMQIQAEFGDKGDSRFTTTSDRIFMRRARLILSGRFLEDVELRLDGDFANASLAGTAPSNNAVLNEGFIVWNHYSWANLRFGQFKAPFGFEMMTPEAKVLTTERTLGSDRLALGRQIGAQLLGDVLDKRFSYTFAVVNGTSVNVSANDNDKFNLVGRLAGIPFQGKLGDQDAKLSVGVDGYTTRDAAVSQGPDFGFSNNSFAGRRYGLGVDAQFHLGRADLLAEYLEVNFSPNNRLPAEHFKGDAFYTTATYFVIPNLVQALVRFDRFDPNSLKSGDETKTWTFGLTYLIKGEDLRIQLNYLRMKAAGTSAEQNKLIIRSQTLF